MLTRVFIGTIYIYIYILCSVYRVHIILFFHLLCAYTYIFYLFYVFLFRIVSFFQGQTMATQGI